VLVAGFVAAISVPGLMTMLGDPAPAAASLTEELGRARSIAKRVQVIKNRFATRFALRQPLIKVAGVIKVEALGVTSSTSVVLGADGWLFFADDGSLDIFRRTAPLSPAQLEQWRQLVDRWARISADAGARLVLVIAPDKPTIYGDFMPAWATQLAPESRLDQLTAALAGRDDIDLVDVRPALRDARRAGLPVFYRTDTHWNQLGSYLATRELARTLARRFPGVIVPPPIARPVILPVLGGGDLARFLGIADRVGDQDVWLAPQLGHAATVRSRATQTITRDIVFEDEVSSTCPGAPIARALVLRDSYGNAMIPHLAELFRDARYLWTTKLHPDQVRAPRPDVIVIEIVERHLMKEPGAIEHGR
jgi:hypothetical protein